MTPEQLAKLELNAAGDIVEDGGPLGPWAIGIILATGALGSWLAL